MACEVCTYVKASEVFDEAYHILSCDMSEEEAEEIKYELWCKLNHEKKRSGKMVERGSNLAKVIGFCADTAIYLPKKRFENLDDYKVIVFDADKNSAYLTNNDVIVRLSAFPEDTLAGMDPRVNTYDYLQEIFIPNPLPHSTDDLDKSLNSIEGFPWGFSVPIEKVLDKIYRVCPESLARRNTLLVMDVGYGMFEGSIPISKFVPDENGKCMHIFGDGKRGVIDPYSSLIGSDFIYKDTPYLGLPTYIDKDVIYLNVYKEYNDNVTFGIYEILNELFLDDIHPFSLTDYAENRLIKFPLTYLSDPPIDMTKEYFQERFQNFEPMAFETEYIYNIFFLLMSFGYKYANIYIQKQDLPILIEGFELGGRRPKIEAVVSPVLVGRSGKECEEVIGSQSQMIVR